MNVIRAQIIREMRKVELWEKRRKKRREDRS